MHFNGWRIPSGSGSGSVSGCVRLLLHAPGPLTRPRHAFIVKRRDRETGIAAALAVALLSLSLSLYETSDADALRVLGEHTLRSLVNGRDWEGGRD